MGSDLHNQACVGWTMDGTVVAVADSVVAVVVHIVPGSQECLRTCLKYKGAASCKPPAVEAGVLKNWRASSPKSRGGHDSLSNVVVPTSFGIILLSMGGKSEVTMMNLMLQ